MVACKIKGAESFSKGENFRRHGARHDLRNGPVTGRANIHVQLCCEVALKARKNRKKDEENTVKIELTNNKQQQRRDAEEKREE